MATALATAGSAVVAAAGLPVALATPARAQATIVVDTVAHGLGVAGCTVEEAFLAANQDSATVTYDPGYPYASTTVDTGCSAGNGPDVIRLAASTYAFGKSFRERQNHTGPAALPFVTSDITVEGSGAVLARTATEPFRLAGVGPTGSLTVRDVEVQGFFAQGGKGVDGGGGGLGAGGALFVHGGTLNVERSTFDGNQALGGNGGLNAFPDSSGGGGGGGLGGSGSYSSRGGGGGGGARGDGGDPLHNFNQGGGGGGTLLDGGFDADGRGGVTTTGGEDCGGGGDPADGSFGTADGGDGFCPGGGGGGGGDGILLTGDGGAGAFAGGGGGGAQGTGYGGHGGFGGGGGGAGTASASSGGGGGDAGFGGGGGAGPGHDVLGVHFGGPGAAGTFGGHASDLAGGGGAALGGAIFGYQATIDVTNSTFTNNSVARGVAGGTGAANGGDAGGAIFTVAGSLTVVNATIAGNATTGDGGGVAVYKPSGEATSVGLYNTIIAGNSQRDECFLQGAPSSVGTGNLVTPHAGDAKAPCPGIDVTADPVLGALAANHPAGGTAVGLTPTMAIAVGSPALDAGNPIVVLSEDQRRVSRPQGAGPDIGAYELEVVTDSTPPTSSPTASPAANGSGWNNSDVTVAWNWSDSGGSGVDPASCTASSTSSGEGASLTLSATCKDLAGNEGTASRQVSVDKTPPTVTCGAPLTYTLGGNADANVTATVADGLSGPVMSEVSADVTAADVATAGVKSVSLTGADRAGNTTTVSCTYLVAYRFLGFLQPIPQTSFKAGTTIPVKFRLGDATGQPISDAAAQALLSPTCDVQVLFDGRVVGCATYDPLLDQFQVDLKTSRKLPAGAHTISIRVSAPDGSGVLNTDAVTVQVRA